MTNRPPRWAARLFEFLLPFDRFGSTLADVEEVYDFMVAEQGRARATRWYLAQVGRAIPPGISNAVTWGIYMLVHYAISAFRSMKRNKLASSVNFLGMSIAVGASIVMFLFVDLQFNMDRFHENAEDIYLVEYELSVGGETQAWANSPAPLGPAAQQMSPDVEAVVRVVRSSAAVRYGGQIFNESIRLVDPAFLDVFSFPLVAGSAAGLAEPDGIVLSESMAKKYFESEDPVGATMTLKFRDHAAESFKVSGVAKDTPLTASFGFDFLAGYEGSLSAGARSEDWSNWVAATFLLVNPSASATSLNGTLQDLVPLMQAANEDRQVSRIMAVPLLDVPTQAMNLRGSMLSSIHPATAWMCLIIALLVLAVASFNHVNIAIVTAMGRAKEIGVRKVVGSYRWQLILQFLGENLVVSFLALLAGTLLAGFLFIPWLNGLVAADGEGFALNYSDNKLLWLFLGGILGLTGIGAGLYPAFFISSFDPASVLKGGVAIAGKRRLTKVLLSSQFIFSFLLLALSIAVVENASNEREKDWGYNQEQTLVVRFEDAPSLTAFEQVVAQHAGVIRSSGSAQHISGDGQDASVTVEGVQYEARSFRVGFGYLETMKLRLERGRFFHPDQSTDIETAVVVNQTFLDEIKPTVALGGTIRMGPDQLTIVGVVEDFYHMPFILGIDPVLFRVVDKAEYRYLAMDVLPGQSNIVFDHLKDVWAGQSPDAPFDGFFQDSVFDSYFFSMSRSSGIFVFIATIALIIAAMGLVGFVLITISRRTREIGIRKVVGANVWDLLKVTQRDMIGVVVVAIAVGAVLSYVAVKALLNAMIPAGLDIGNAFVLAPAVLIFSVALLTSLSAGFRGAMVNPIDSLRQSTE